MDGDAEVTEEMPAARLYIDSRVLAHPPLSSPRVFRGRSLLKGCDCDILHPSRSTDGLVPGPRTSAERTSVTSPNARRARRLPAAAFGASGREAHGLYRNILKWTFFFSPRARSWYLGLPVCLHGVCMPVALRRAGDNRFGV